MRDFNWFWTREKWRGLLVLNSLFFRGGSLTPGPGGFSLSGERLGGEPLVGEGLYWGA